MAGNRIYRTLAYVLAVTLLLASTFAVTSFYLGGFWENWAPLDRISGPQRFRQYVADPIPSGIYDIRGGYSSLPQNEIITYFRFGGDIATSSFLKNWNELRSYDTTAPFVPCMLVIGANRVYLKSGAEGYSYLLIAEKNNRGVLYVPVTQPMLSMRLRWLFDK